MKDVFEVIQMLRRFGTYVYTGDRESDLHLLMTELKDLYEMGMIEQKDYLHASLLLKNEISRL
ncbi:YqgQ family protein [Sporosarcina sp. HYO08]|uniref:YqgQ family protein n=1 Tax=Sporosarcina sp. HYO08 TaxID=1759557 RepID=UPI0007942C5E|nr:YqgQ family protein [Sporosarcina sp. HYO08]KXH87440.1 hypothetical protein AU377_02390 [Sporosarcina sp. HYO08]